MEISEAIPLSDYVSLGRDSLITLTIIAIDEYGGISKFEHLFDPIDIQPPTISIDFDNSHGYPPGDSVAIHIIASDNEGLYNVTISTSGAFLSNSIVEFDEPYPTEIDSVIYIPVPLGNYLSTNFWITAEAMDINFNSAESCCA